MISVHVYFRQRAGLCRTVSKTLTLACVPSIGMYFEYADGWGLAEVRNMHVTASTINIDQYGPQFSVEELEKLEDLGWEVQK